MERLISFGINGGIKMPIGYRFCPTDEELCNFYLKKKVLAQPFPIEIIPEFDVYQTEPWGLPVVFVGGRKFQENRFYFSNTKGHVFGNMDKRAAGSGYWKTLGKAETIVASESNQLIGIKKTLIFEGKLSRGTRTRWFMNEVRLVCSATASKPFQVKVSDWAVYRIFRKKKNPKAKGSNEQLSDSSKVERLEDSKPNFIDFTVEDGSDTGPPPPCSP